MFLTVKFKRIAGHILIIGGILSIIVSLIFAFNFSSLPVSGAEHNSALVIDPGHGGPDSGAVAMNGVRESDINLDISLRLQSIAEFFGIQAYMTRSDDSICTDIQKYSERNELIRRTDFANSVPGAALISIHQNTYPTSQPSGSQVLYGRSKGSKNLGLITHNNLINYLNKENRRVAEPAPEKLYITANANCPVILVECGFISNFSDLEKLCDKNYETAFAAVLAVSYLQFINSCI